MYIFLAEIDYFVKQRLYLNLRYLLPIQDIFHMKYKLLVVILFLLFSLLLICKVQANFPHLYVVIHSYTAMTALTNQTTCQFCQLNSTVLLHV